MSETEPGTGATEPSATDPNEPATGWQAEALKWREHSRKMEARAKENASAAKELEKVRRQAMSDQERAVAEAVDAARADAVAETTRRLGVRLVDAELRAAAAGRLSGEQLDTLAAGLNVASFLTETGDVDRDAVRRFVNGLAPEAAAPAAAPFPDLGQGARPAAATALNGDPLLKDLKRKLGIP